MAVPSDVTRKVPFAKLSSEIWRNCRTFTRRAEIVSTLLSYDDVGHGPAVVLIHAGIADRRMWHEQVSALVTAGFRVVTPDLRGFGDSPPASGPFTHAGDVLAVMDACDI